MTLAVGGEARWIPGAWLDAIIIIAAGAVLAVWSWQKWADPIFDFGRELAIARQIAEGRVLYADIAYDGGPLSPALNALMIWLFGARLDAIIALNFAVLSATVFFFYRILRAVADRFAAVAGCILFLWLFAFGQHTYHSGYNHICPYRHEMTHGLLFCLASLDSLLAYYRRPSLPRIIATGAFLGLAFLTKVEIFLPAFIAISTGVCLARWLQPSRPHGAIRLWAWYLDSMAAPVLAAFLLLLTAMPATEAARGLLSGWTLSAHSAIWSSPFYLESTGLDAPLKNLGLMLRSAGWYALLFGACGLIAFFKQAFRRHGEWLAGAAFILLGAILARQWIEMDWYEAARPLPAVLAFLLAIHLLINLQDPLWFPNRAVLFSRITAIGFALAMLAKILLNSRIQQYGFVLAAPAVLIAAAALLTWIPTGLSRLGGQGGFFRFAGVLFLGIAAASLLLHTDAYFRQKSALLAAGQTQLHADPDRAAPLQAAVELISNETPAGATLAAYPDGAMLNFLTGRPNPTPYFNLMPHEVAYFGEENILASLQAAPPDYIALVDKDTSPFGPRAFGRDYAAAIGAWITENYEPVKLFGSYPFYTGRFGVLVLKHKASQL
jgi:hypothetical protein